MIVSGSPSVRAQEPITLGGTKKATMLGPTTKEGTPKEGITREGTTRELTTREGPTRKGITREGITRVGTETIRAGITRVVKIREVMLREITPKEVATRKLTLEVKTMEPILTVKEVEETLPGRVREPMLVETVMAAITKMEPLLTGTITLVILTEKTMEASPMGRMAAPNPTGTTIPIPMAAPMGATTGATT